MDWHYGHRLGRAGGTLDQFLDAARNASARAAPYAPAARVVFADYSADSGSWSHYLYLTAPGGTAVQIVGNLSACSGAHHAACLDGDGEGMRVFDTCYALGGYTFATSREVEERLATRSFELHPAYDRRAERSTATSARPRPRAGGGARGVLLGAALMSA